MKLDIKRHCVCLIFTSKSLKNIRFLICVCRKSLKTNGFQWFSLPNTMNYKTTADSGMSPPGRGLGGWPHIFFFLRLSPAGGAGLPPGAMDSACVCVQKQHITDHGSSKSELSFKIWLRGCCWLTNQALLMEFANWQDETLHPMTRLSGVSMQLQIDRSQLGQT